MRRAHDDPTGNAHLVLIMGDRKRGHRTRDMSHRLIQHCGCGLADGDQIQPATVARWRLRVGGQLLSEGKRGVSRLDSPVEQ